MCNNHTIYVFPKIVNFQQMALRFLTKQSVHTHVCKWQRKIGWKRESRKSSGKEQVKT